MILAAQRGHEQVAVYGAIHFTERRVADSTLLQRHGAFICRVSGREASWMLPFGTTRITSLAYSSAYSRHTLATLRSQKTRRQWMCCALFMLAVTCLHISLTTAIAPTRHTRSDILPRQRRFCSAVAMIPFASSSAFPVLPMPPAWLGLRYLAISRLQSTTKALKKRLSFTMSVMASIVCHGYTRLSSSTVRVCWTMQ